MYYPTEVRDLKRTVNETFLLQRRSEKSLSSPRWNHTENLNVCPELSSCHHIPTKHEAALAQCHIPLHHE